MAREEGRQIPFLKFDTLLPVYTTLVRKRLDYSFLCFYRANLSTPISKTCSQNLYIPLKMFNTKIMANISGPFLSPWVLCPSNSIDTSLLIGCFMSLKLDLCDKNNLQIN